MIWLNYELREVFLTLCIQSNNFIIPIEMKIILVYVMATKAKSKTTAAKKKVSAKSAAAKKGWATRRKNAK